MHALLRPYLSVRIIILTIVCGDFYDTLPELIIPALLGFVVGVEAFVEQFSIASVCLAIFGGLTFLLGALSLYTLYAVESGGVFFGGLFTIVAGIILSVGVFLHTIARTERFQTASKELMNSLSN